MIRRIYECQPCNLCRKTKKLTKTYHFHTEKCTSLKVTLIDRVNQYSNSDRLLLKQKLKNCPHVTERIKKLFREILFIKCQRLELLSHFLFKLIHCLAFSSDFSQQWNDGRWSIDDKPFAKHFNIYVTNRWSQLCFI